MKSFVIHSKKDNFYSYSGMDSYEHCLNQKLFNQYPHEILYQYNSRGFRDEEWPKDLPNAIWCVGDSYTVGIGNPRPHTWTYLLEQTTNNTTINVSMDGASNNWIARKAIHILDIIKPNVLILHWSFVNRRENNNVLLNDEDRAIHFLPGATAEQDTDDTLNCISLVDQCANATKIIHSFVPGFLPAQSQDLFFNKLVTSNAVVDTFPKFDLGRDGAHYGIKTAEFFVDKLLTHLK